MDWLKGNRIKLRALEPTDIDDLYKWENDSELWHVSDTVTPYSKYLLKEYIESAPKDIYENRQLRLVIEAEPDGKNESVGAIDLFEYDPYHNRAAIGIFVDKAYQRNGYGSEAMEVIKKYAFSYLHLKMLYCHVGADNPVSVSFFKNAGFEVCGQLKEWLKGVNGYVDSYVLQCINPDV
ncbi:GNAT family N-acetyltransferase [Saccharicrinis sp. FJH2]|uniref:GNAT family N-acetyltransferase n=1 Tax=unclassified Saccharicrinis TaxID=2646859 RepID=UPI0035D4EA5A